MPVDTANIWIIYKDRRYKLATTMAFDNFFYGRAVLN